MKYLAASLLLAALLSISACSDNTPPVKLGDAQANYIGTWEHAGEIPDDHDSTDNMLLVIHPGSTVSYVRCVAQAQARRVQHLPDLEMPAEKDS